MGRSNVTVMMMVMVMVLGDSDDKTKAMIAKMFEVLGADGPSSSLYVMMRYRPRPPPNTHTKLGWYSGGQQEILPKVKRNEVFVVKF